MDEPKKISARLEDLETRVSDLEQLIHDTHNGDNVTGMREFVENVDPDTHVERALAIAYYMDQFLGEENFTTKDIEEGYRTCRVQKPANMSDTVAELDKKGWAMDNGKDGQTRLRRLTGGGLNKIEEVIDDES